MSQEPKSGAPSATVPLVVLSLSGAAASSAMTGSAVPMAFAGAAVVLSGVVRWVWRRGRRAAPERAGLEGLAASQREQVRVLEELSERILAGYRRLPGGGVLAASSERRLDGLVDAFVRLLGSLNAYRQWLNAADRASVEAEVKALEAEVAQERAERLREVKAKRLAILRQRLERFEKAAESRELVSHQLATIEDVLRLTFEQSIAIRDPEVVARQLDQVAAEVASTQETAREMEQFLELTDESDAVGLAPRVRVR